VEVGTACTKPFAYAGLPTEGQTRGKKCNKNIINEVYDCTECDSFLNTYVSIQSTTGLLN